MKNEKLVLRFGGTKRNVDGNKPDFLVVGAKLMFKFSTKDGLSVNSIRTCSN